MIILVLLLLKLMEWLNGKKGGKKKNKWIAWTQFTNVQTYFYQIIIVKTGYKLAYHNSRISKKKKKKYCVFVSFHLVAMVIFFCLFLLVLYMNKCTETPSRRGCKQKKNK